MGKRQTAKRIGDAERDHATELLSDHLAAGRLSPEEFEARMTRALTALTAADLEPLFSDLPGENPGTPVVEDLTTTNRRRVLELQAAARARNAPPAAPPTDPRLLALLAVVVVLSWVGGIAVYLLTGFQNWWLLVVAVGLSILLGNLWRRGRNRATSTF